MKDFLNDTYNLDRKTVIILLLCTVIIGFIELISLGLFLPYFNYLGNYQSSKLSLLGIITDYNFLQKSFILFIFLCLTSLSSIFLTYFINKRSYLLAFDLSSDLLRNIMSSSYAELNNSSKDNQFSKIYNESIRYAAGVIGMLFQIIAKGISSILIISYLSFLNFKLTITVFVFFSILYIIISIKFNPILKNNSSRISKFLENRKKIIDNILNGYEVIKVYNQQENFISIFDKTNKQYSRALSLNQTLSSIPKYIIELVVFSMIILYAVYSFNNKNLENIGLIIFTFGGTALKLIPLMNSTYSSYAKFKSFFNSYDVLKNDIRKIHLDKKYNSLNIVTEKLITNLDSYPNKISIKNLSFSFEDNEQIFNNLSLDFEPNNWYVIKGRSGVGKSTLARIILGLYEFSHKNIFYSDIPLNRIKIENYCQIFGYVSQKPLITEDSIFNNVSFGHPLSKTDFNNLVKNLEIDFSDKLYLNQKLSGGQYQRVSIARALARNPKVLILDEAYSALDSKSKSLILKSIKNYFDMKKQIIIIEITHDLFHDYATKKIKLT